MSGRLSWGRSGGGGWTEKGKIRKGKIGTVGENWRLSWSNLPKIGRVEPKKPPIFPNDFPLFCPKMFLRFSPTFFRTQSGRVGPRKGRRGGREGGRGSDGRRLRREVGRRREELRWDERAGEGMRGEGGGGSEGRGGEGRG